MISLILSILVVDLTLLQFIIQQHQLCHIVLQKTINHVNYLLLVGLYLTHKNEKRWKSNVKWVNSCLNCHHALSVMCQYYSQVSQETQNQWYICPFQYNKSYGCTTAFKQLVCVRSTTTSCVTNGKFTLSCARIDGDAGISTTLLRNDA